MSRGCGEFCQACHNQIWLGFGCLDSAHAGSGRGTIDPYRRQTKSLGGNHVVINALAHVQDTMRVRVDAT